jgi:NAD(P)-dependent dehydrogenase (short-subunit alcohol dehydrogenase family)
MASQKILITGGAAGIGAAIAARAAADGYTPVIIDRVPNQAGDGIIADLSDPAATQAALAQALAGGPITRLVNNVGIVSPAAAEDQTLAAFDLTISLNLRCAMQCMQALLPGMRQARFGRIVNMASRAALGKEHRTAYAATKAGIIGMTRVWALEFAGQGITVNAIGPGPIATELFNRANPAGAARTQSIIDAVPVRRLGTADDIAHAASYLLDQRSGFITGQTLYICGGMTIGVAPI